MRTDPALFSIQNLATEKEPRFVVNIVYDVASIYITSHAGISGVPGTVVDGALIMPTVNSQRINPDEGSSEIGSASFSLIDSGSAFTDAVRDQLFNNLQGMRGRTVRFYVGYSALGFSDFVLIGTQVVTNAIYRKGSYEISCNDIQRSTKSTIFDVFQTTLSATISATDTTITLASVSGLEMVAHGTSYSDAPSSTVGYVKIGEEIVRYTGINGGLTQITGCTRGALGTVARAFTVDPSSPVERREKVTEYVYLELPAIDLAYRILTGKDRLGNVVMPATWHLGIDTALVDLPAFEAIGKDLWDTSDATLGFVVRFTGSTKTEGKRFLEKEIYLLCGVYSPVTSDGKLSLRRMARIVETSPGAAIINEANSTQIGDLVHDFDSLHNAFSVSWSFDGKDYRRRTVFVDSASISQHGQAPVLELQFKGLVGTRHSDGVIFQRLDAVRDRYAGPPLRMTVECLPSMNRIEIGDILRVQYASVRDFTKAGTSIDRAFEVQSVSINQRTGRVSLELFGSTASSSVDSPTAAATALPDAYYASGGTSLATQIGGALSGNTIVSNCNLPSGIYRHAGPLTINSGVTVTVNGTVQLRVMGFLTVNGTIDGIGRGKAGVADTGQAITLITNGNFPQPAVNQILGTPGFLGPTIGGDGVDYSPPDSSRTPYVHTRAARSTPGTQSAGAPVVAPTVSGGQLVGFFDDLAGTGGGPGGRGGQAVDTVLPAYYGGAGGNGGAGLILICRGMGVGVSAVINLSGADGTSPAATSYTILGIAHSHYPGSGAAGMPGAAYIFLDGSGLSVPDLGSKFIARSGVTTLQGSPLLVRSYAIIPRPGRNLADPENPIYYPATEPVGGWRGSPEQPQTTALDMSLSALRIQFIAAAQTAVDDIDTAPPPVTDLDTFSRVGGVNVVMAVPDRPAIETVQVFASQVNDRTTSVLEFEGLASQFTDRYFPSVTKYYWARTTRTGTTGQKLFSTFFPVSATAGVAGAPASSKFLTTGNCLATDVSVGKFGGSPAFDSSGYSVDGFQICHLQFKSSPSHIAGTGNDGFLMGLTTDPTADSDFTSIDFAWHPQDTGLALIYENGTLVGTFGTWSSATEFALQTDGVNISYILDRVVVRTVAVTGAPLYMDSSFFASGNLATSIRFGAGLALEFAEVNTNEISENAATELVELTGISFTTSTSSTVVFDQISYGVLPFDCTALMTFSCDARYPLSSGGFDFPTQPFLQIGCPQGASGAVSAGRVVANIDFSGSQEINLMVPLLAGASPDFEVRGNGGSNAGAMAVISGTLKVELIKR